MGKTSIKQRAFTIVELLVVIAVIGTLAGISVVGYGAWQKRTVESVVKSDLNNAVSAMESARNFGNTYPAALPASFSPSDKVVVAATSTTGTSYCIQAASTRDSTVIMYATNTSTTPQYGNCISTSGLVAWWPLNGSATDVSGSGINGTVVGATLTAGKNGTTDGAYSFNGSSTYITMPTISIPTAVSTSAWVYSANFAQSGFVVGKNTVNTQWEIFFGGSYLYWRGGAADSNTTCSLPANSAWHHVVGSQTGTTTKLYIDGVLCRTATSTAIGNSTGTVEIGRFNSGYYYNGTIDDVRVYNRALSDAEVLGLYNSGAQ